MVSAADEIARPLGVLRLCSRSSAGKAPHGRARGWRRRWRPWVVECRESERDCASQHRGRWQDEDGGGYGEDWGEGSDPLEATLVPSSSKATLQGEVQG